MTPASVVLFVLLAGASQESAPQLASPVLKGADLMLLREVREVGKRVEAIRGEKFERPLIAIRAPDSVREVAAEIRAYNVLASERLEARGRAWNDIGLGGPASPSVLFKTLAADLAGIGFDPTKNRMLVSPDRLPASDFVRESDDDPSSTVLLVTGVRPDEPLLAHLAMHIRQRERSTGDWLADTTDALLARAAWAEGEANLVALRHLFDGLGMADDIVQAGLSPADYLEGSLVSPALERLSGIEAGLVRFAYIDGFDRVAAIFAEGGWPAVDIAMARGRATADLLHPRAAPKEPASFTTPSPPLEDLELVDEDVIGEHAIFVLIATLTGKDTLGLTGADGWVGDRLYRWEPGDDADPARGATVWLTRWSSPREASGFEYALGRTLSARFPDREFETPAPGTRTLRGGGRVFRLRIEGAEVQVGILPEQPAAPGGG